jgi:hypothetical protein
MNIKPGWQTTEFWTALVSQALALLTVLGFLTAADARTLEDALGKCVAAVFLFATNAWIVVSYIRARLELKRGGVTHSPSPGPRMPMLLVGTVALGLVAGPLQAHPLLPWRAQIEQRLRDQQQQINHLLSQRPAQPPILLPGPLPIQGEPRQLLPIPGEPRQLLPVPGDPRQQVPIPGPPRQELPIRGEPRQELPWMPPAASGPQNYSVFIRALTQPREK